MGPNIKRVIKSLPSSISNALDISLTQLRDPLFQVQRKKTTEKFKLHITDKGTKLDEEIEIDEDNDIKYFKVPPHNELSETGNLYDFKMVRNCVTVSLISRYITGQLLCFSFCCSSVSMPCIIRDPFLYPFSFELCDQGTFEL